ncbi:hypothetical protein F5050DRAFT_1028819 [Lentinula boryana]|uniref:DUF6533 domain-containing protein n=1 Tax=Lentinula boryana TaxID=40481 RepID=A0ABQ8QL48_9AGAR|nr:hypothetical protein F5050DRAFT_1028819 [Lentinula boryana]
MNWTHYIHIVEFTIVVYDYFLTLDAEIERYWGSRTTFATTLFYVNRYSTILGLIPRILFDFWPEPILRLRVIRLYVIYEYRRWIAILLSVMKTCAAGNSLESIFHILTAWCKVSDRTYPSQLQLYFSRNVLTGTDYSSPVIYQNGCNQITTRQQGHYMAYSWLGVVIFDLCIFGLTLWKTLRMRRYYALYGGIGTILMRDGRFASTPRLLARVRVWYLGAIYFGIVALINCANILFFILGSDLTRDLLATFCTVSQTQK